MDRSHEAKNYRQRERLRTLIDGWGDAVLQRAMPAGWTVAGVLAHLAFWDARAVYLLDKWAAGAEPSVADQEPPDIDWVNDASKPLCLALPVRDAAALALRMAEEADRKVTAMSDDLLAKAIAAGTPFNLSRASHRGEHLDEIENVLAGRPPRA